MRSIRYRALGLLAVLALAAPAMAQTTTPTPAAPEEASRTFLTRSAFHMSAEHLSSDDPRFVWDTNFGGDLDLVDYGRGRLNFAANYQAILGEEFRQFDPTQGNYFLTGSLSARVRPVEVAMVFHHESRHLSDRAKRQAVDWNMFGVRVLHEARTDRVTLHSRADLRGVVQKSYVDYRWELQADTRADIALRPGVGLLAAAAVQRLGTDGTRARDGETGVRAEGGVRLAGRGAAVELFVSAERRVDPYPLEFGTMSWVGAGFRLLSR